MEEGRGKKEEFSLPPCNEGRRKKEEGRGCCRLHHLAFSSFLSTLLIYLFFFIFLSRLRRRQCQTPSLTLSLPTNISPNIIHVGFAAAKLLNIINITKVYLNNLTFSGAKKEAISISTTPTPPYNNEGTRTTLQTSRQSLARGLTEKLQNPTAFRGFWYRGTRDELFIGWRIGS